MRSRKVAIARHCRKGPAHAYPAIRDGWPAGTRKQAPFAAVVSGDQQAYNTAKPALDGITDKAFHLGDFGVGTKMKFAANLLVGVHILATAEVLAMSAKVGLSHEQVIKILSPSAAESLQFQVR